MSGKTPHNAAVKAFLLRRLVVFCLALTWITSVTSPIHFAR